MNKGIIFWIIALVLILILVMVLDFTKIVNRVGTEDEINRIELFDSTDVELDESDASMEEELQFAQ